MFNRFITSVITKIILRTRVLGKENIPKELPVIFVANHTSTIDEILINTSISNKVTFVMYRKENKKFLWNTNIHFIKRPEEDKGKEFDEYCLKLKEEIKAGRSICFFPEKKITANGYINRFYDEISIVFGQKLSVPVIPVYLGPLWGTGFSLFKAPKESRQKLVNIVFGKPIDNIDPFNIRQAVSELSADAGMLNDYKEKTLQYKFMCNAKKRPFKKILCDSDGKELSNIQILVGAMILSKRFSKLKSHNRNIGILMPSCNAGAVTILATLFSGFIPSMLNFSLAKNVFEACIDKAELDTIITSKLFIIKLDMEERKEMVFLEDIAKTISKQEKIFTFIKALLIPSLILIKLIAENYKDLHKTAVMLFSSGSSGVPKAILLSHHNLNADVSAVINVSTCRAGEDKITGNLPLFHSFGINVCFWVPLMHGTKVVYIKSPIDYEAVVSAIRKYKLSVLCSTPSFLNNYIRKAGQGDFSSLKIVILGAEKMNPMHVERFREKLGIEPIEGFGCTELSPIVSVNFGEDYTKIGKQIGKVGSIGKALPGIAAKIVHVDTLEDLPPDQEGLLLIKGAVVMEGYYNDEQITKDAINDGWYNTQDIASIDGAGYISITGRLSRFSKIAGEMVSHEIIETMIRTFRGDVENAIVVTGTKDHKKGEKIIVLYTGKEIHPDKINKYLSKNGLNNLWIPKTSDYYHIDNIPLLGSGKLDLYKLDKIAANFAS